ncbi:hypothetical protein C8R44DRAFT_750972 [Mycena epipterygia]|nr:hypothetical protein C8R44DRAFT_750972 [Mycena epipterygia]
MGCCLGMAKCLRQENDLEIALAWCEEISSLHQTTYLTSEHPLYDWRTWTLDIPEMTFLRSSGSWLASEIFASLGNSATVATQRWVAASTMVNTPENQKFQPSCKRALNYELQFTPKLWLKLLLYRGIDKIDYPYVVIVSGAVSTRTETFSFGLPSELFVVLGGMVLMPKPPVSFDSSFTSNHHFRDFRALVAKCLDNGGNLELIMVVDVTTESRRERMDSDLNYLIKAFIGREKGGIETRVE